MIVDDSAIVRGIVTRWLNDEPDLNVVASVHTGRDAVDKVERADPDVVILDIEMPELDGLSALPLLLAKKRDLVVIMASALTRRQAEVSLKALALGATDYVPKPDANRGFSTSPEFRRELTEKIRQLGRRRIRRLRFARRDLPIASPRLVPSGTRDESCALSSETASPLPVLVRPAFAKPPRVLLVGASTGGPQALTALMAQLSPVIDRFPVLVVQHMPPTFTTILAEHLTRAGGRPAREPEDGDAIVPGVINLAPGGRHMRVERSNGNPVVRLDDGPAVNFCKPAVDPLFISASQVWPGATQAVILTGMGHDGTEGARAVAASGGSVIAQDEATSVVWGMPGSAAHAGVCSAVLPLEQIAPKLVRIFSGDVA